jgi:hypothetical protein
VEALTRRGWSSHENILTSPDRAWEGGEVGR